MDEEIYAIEKNNTWELITLPSGKKPIGVKWVYKTKFRLNDKIDHFKAWLVAEGYKQKQVLITLRCLLLLLNLIPYVCISIIFGKFFKWM